MSGAATKLMVGGRGGGACAQRPLPAPVRAWRMLRIAALFLLFALFTAVVTAFASVRRRERFTRWWAGRVLRALGVTLICGRSPGFGTGPALLVANHVSSIDPILICAIQPACFVAKSELGNSAWLRWLLAEAGTIFIDRGKRDGVLSALAAMHDAFDAGEQVALFPEATICAAAEPRPFNSALLEAGSEGVPLYFFALSLTRADGTLCPEADFPWERSFAAGFWRLAGVPALVARVEVVGPVDFQGVNRKRIARSAHDAIHYALRYRHAGRCSCPRALRAWASRIAQSAIAASLCYALVQGPVLAEGVDIGAGFGLVSQQHGLEGGWDIQVGYEFKETERFSLGVQWQWFKGWTSENRLGDHDQGGMAFSSNALYLTARPRHEALRWLQLKAGLVNANYKIAEYDSAAGTVVVRSDRSGETGLALGLGLVFGSDKVRLHLLDYQRYSFAGESFDAFGISLVLLAGGH